MKASLRRRFEMAKRVRDFLRQHVTSGVAEQAALRDLEALIDRADMLARQQLSGLNRRHASTADRSVIRRTLQQKLLHYVAGVGAKLGKQEPEMAEWFRLPKATANNQAFLTMAHAMYEHATLERDLLVSRGLSETVLDDLGHAIAEFEKTLETTRASMRDHIGASGDLLAVASEITRQVRLLEGLVRYRFGNDAELMAAWANARNVVGPSHHDEEDIAA